MPYSKLSRHASSLGLCAAAGLAGLLVMAPRASAADLDPGYADVPAPMTQQQLQFGSGWYVRGDVAATDSTYKVGSERTGSGQTVDFALARDKSPGYNLSLGGGYAFTSNIRADIVADFLQPTESRVPNQRCITSARYTCTLEGDFDRYDALVNAYYDIGTWSVFTPYVGAGAGVGFGNVKDKLYDTSVYSGSLNYHSFAWALMAGVAIDVYPHVKLDVGYRYLDNGTVYGTHLYNHEARAGIRYMIDN